MEIGKVAQVLIIVHASLGGVALLMGALALIARKGNSKHKKSGKVFYFSMLTSAIISLIVSVLPDHESPFLFSIGVFSMYFLISGLRSLRFRQKNVSLKLDKIISFSVIVTGSLMMLYPILLYGKLNIVLLVFGAFGVMIGISDLRYFKNVERLKSSWLNLHLGKMIGGYIAAVTAFFVVNNVLPGIWNWFVPGVIGGFYIAYWSNKVKA